MKLKLNIRKHSPNGSGKSKNESPDELIPSGSLAGRLGAKRLKNKNPGMRKSLSVGDMLEKNPKMSVSQAPKPNERLNKTKEMIPSGSLAGRMIPSGSLAGRLAKNIVKQKPPGDPLVKSEKKRSSPDLASKDKERQIPARTLTGCLSSRRLLEMKLERQNQEEISAT